MDMKLSLEKKKQIELSLGLNILKIIIIVLFFAIEEGLDQKLLMSGLIQLDYLLEG